LIKCDLDSKSIVGQRMRKFTGGQAFGGVVVLAAALAHGMKRRPEDLLELLRPLARRSDLGRCSRHDLH
jgi:hypothetical protein